MSSNFIECRQQRDEGVCLTVKDIGKPCARKPQAQFGEGGLVK
jgi:hypothetical protein